jgi:hypothetical protein
VSLLSRLAPRASGLPRERDWQRSDVLEPRLVARGPKLISDGAGPPFSPAALAAAPGSLDPEDPAVGALIAAIGRQRAPKAPPRERRDGDTPASPASATLAGWRLLARTDREAVFGRGYPPQLLTLAVQLDARGRTWTCSAVTKEPLLRVARDGIRASSWRLDPSHELEPDQTVLRILVTEQTHAGAQRATGRVLRPDLHFGNDELVLTMFITPKPGFQFRAPNPETPVRVALPRPVGLRTPIDGALYDAMP